MKNDDKKNNRSKESQKPSDLLKTLQKKISSLRKGAQFPSFKKNKKDASISIQKIAVANSSAERRGTAQDNGYNAELYKFNPPKEQRIEAPAPIVTDVSIPERYSDDRIIIMYRDPWWIYSYWDISEERKNGVINTISENDRQNMRLLIRVYDVTGKDFNGYNAHYYFDIDVPSLNANWYINTNHPGRSFCVEIGFLTAAGRFYLLARSNVLKAPRYGISSIIDELWMLPDEEFFKILNRWCLHTRSSFEEKNEMHWETFFEQFFKSQISSGEFSSLFSFIGKEERRRREFFLEVWTDVIVYGRTMADADVTLCGKKVNLSKEGTFRAHFTLPKGKFNFPVEATSNDKIDTLKLTPIVERKE